MMKRASQVLFMVRTYDPSKPVYRVDFHYSTGEALTPKLFERVSVGREYLTVGREKFHINTMRIKRDSNRVGYTPCLVQDLDAYLDAVEADRLENALANALPGLTLEQLRAACGAAGVTVG